MLARGDGSMIAPESVARSVVMIRKLAAFALLVSPLAFAADLPRTPAPAGAEVYFIAPEDGATVSSPVVVRFGLKGMGVAPAGIQVEKTGHHHLLVDVDTLPPFNQPLPKDDKHLHFGAGQTETTLTLAPGKHTLQLIVGDYLHLPHDPPIMSPKITITVK
jgi:Domain of unknown function (DUF4399)